MSLPNNDDVVSVSIHLKELQSQFDRAMREGCDFATLKKIHMQIKELECHLHALEWDPDTNRTDMNVADPSMENRFNTHRRSSNRFRHLNEPPPLL